MRRIVTFLLIVVSASYSIASSQAVILTYHRIGESKYSSTNVSQVVFRTQMRWLYEHKYHVWSLEKIVHALEKNKPIPKHTVGISFDDAYRSVYSGAWPVLRQYHYPFTVFVATNPVQHHFGDMMSWPQLKELVAQGVTIGNHSTTHTHLADLSTSALRKEIVLAQSEIEQNLHVSPTLFAYPYGEYNRYVQTMVQRLGFSAAFAQVSGAVNEYSDRFALPRFPLNEHYSHSRRFAFIVNMSPFNITALQPEDTLPQHNPPKVAFNVRSRTITVNSLACYANNGAQIKVNTLKWPKVQLILDRSFPKGRARINCTAKDATGHWHWLGLIFLIR